MWLRCMSKGRVMTGMGGGSALKEPGARSAVTTSRQLDTSGQTADVSLGLRLPAPLLQHRSAQWPPMLPNSHHAQAASSSTTSTVAPDRSSTQVAVWAAAAHAAKLLLP